MQTAADIVNSVMKKLVELCVEGAKVLDLCVEGDKLLEQGTGAVYNKTVKGVKVPKGELSQFFSACSCALLTGIVAWHTVWNHALAGSFACPRTPSHPPEHYTQ